MKKYKTKKNIVKLAMLTKDIGAHAATYDCVIQFLLPGVQMCPAKKCLNYI